ncbi:hypothetical protein EH165_00880 [Nakamurella antarctica]|uniref:Uncharacterized protein n=1 Tax=Nakamurella antarctica TaxID=1902245 RepID=A0A3G8ZID2_9ACTN|nr:hypothetical protein [Nakamurella antarctica]AZI56938.1 hypothetical protein EH165_00880 [Nakamurella antarctica]
MENTLPRTSEKACRRIVATSTIEAEELRTAVSRKLAGDDNRGVLVVLHERCRRDALVGLRIGLAHSAPAGCSWGY